MKRIAVAIAVLCVASLMLGAQGPTASKSASPTGEAAQARATQYYTAMAAGNFSEVWAFFGSRMRADNPREEYVASTKQTLRNLKPTGPTTIVSVTKTGVDQRPIAKLQTSVALVGADGSQGNGVQVTEWIWQRSPTSEEENWFLVRETMTANVRIGTN